jgi:hypothetical protein
MYSQNVVNGQIVLTAWNPLMYYPQVGILSFLYEYNGRLLKLVDRADLGSVGDEP